MRCPTLAALTAAAAVLALSACTADNPASEPTGSAPGTLAESPESPESEPSVSAPAMPEYGVPFETPSGLTITVAEPRAAAGDFAERWGDVVDMDIYTEEVILDVTAENTTDAPVELSEVSFNVFSGTYDSDYLSCESDVIPPLQLPPTRTTTWPECFAVEDPADVIVTFTVPDDITTYSIVPEQ
jgi:hypothetical protein